MIKPQVTISKCFLLFVRSRYWSSPLDPGLGFDLTTILNLSSPRSLAVLAAKGSHNINQLRTTIKQNREGVSNDRKLT